MTKIDIISPIGRKFSVKAMIVFFSNYLQMRKLAIYSANGLSGCDSKPGHHVLRDFNEIVQRFFIGVKV